MSRMKRLLLLVPAVVLGASLALGQMLEYFEVWAAGNPNTDQDSKNKVVHSGLVGWRRGINPDVRDDALANMAAPAVMARTRFVWAFGQCYGGGMLDELAALNGTQSATSAARHNQTARYPMARPNGVGEDWVTRYLATLAAAGATARSVAAFAAQNDPFGTNPNAPRIRERMGTENPQYFTTGAVADGLALYQPDGIAILWSGQPNIHDKKQIVDALNKLVLMGYKRDKIFVFYGSGKLMGNHPIVMQHMLGNPAITLRAATHKALSGLFAAKFNAAAKCKPDFVFFLANDHGFNTNLGAAARGGDMGDPDTYPDDDADSEDGEHGGGDSDMYGFTADVECTPDGGEPFPDAGMPPPVDAGSPAPWDAGTRTW